MQLTSSGDGRPWLPEDVVMPPSTVERAVLSIPRSYSRPCRWCGTAVSTVRLPQGEFAICGTCHHGQCSGCGREILISSTSSQPLETRLCRSCRADARAKNGCSSCGAPMNIMPKSRPVGQRMCHACRRDRREKVQAMRGRPIDLDALLARVLAG